jgi:uncharacterized protein YlzI (FlbEa/FlbD family)
MKTLTYTEYSGRTGIVMLDKIMAISQQRDFTVITLVDGHKLESRDSLGELQARIEEASK